MAYVPPALRRKQEAAVKGKDESSNESSRQQSFDPTAKHDSRSLKDIQKHFWPNWVSETPTLLRKSRGNSIDAKNADGELDHHGNAVVDAGDVCVNQENASKPLGAALSGRDHSMEANFKTDKQSDPSQQPQKQAQYKSGESQKSPASHTQQLGDSQSEEMSTSYRRTLISNDGNDATTDRSPDTLEVNLPLLESIHPHNTLNSAEQSPDSLQYVLLFHDANPRWRSDQIVYVKSALELLPTVKHDDEAKTQSASRESLAKNIMVFEQQNGHRTPTSAMFKFIGYFNLIKMQILEPQSPELVRMQEQKWTRMDKYGRPRPINRNAEGWKKSLNQRWAVLGFEKDKGATEELKPPQIEMSNRQDTDGDVQKEKRSVNDLLKEMRMNDRS